MTIDEHSTLEDVCFAVAHALEERGIKAVLTGGSAAALYAPHAYASADADFVLEAHNTLDDVAGALAKLGYAREGRSRIFRHPRNAFTLDFPRGPLAVGGDYVNNVSSINRGNHSIRILSPTDAVRDRLAHFYHWGDYTALNAAVAIAVSQAESIDIALLRTWTKNEGAEFDERLEEFVDRARAAGALL